LTSLSAFHKISTSSIRSPRETISQIAAHYNIKSSAIYDLNPDSRKGIKFKSILLIPTLVSKLRIPYHQLKIPRKNHSVLSKETLYGIARQYGVTVEDLNKLNPTLQKSGLKREIKSESQEPNQIKT
jgi:LysM repeat protein